MDFVPGGRGVSRSTEILERRNIAVLLPDLGEGVESLRCVGPSGAAGALSRFPLLNPSYVAPSFELFLLLVLPVLIRRG